MATLKRSLVEHNNIVKWVFEERFINWKKCWKMRGRWTGWPGQRTLHVFFSGCLSINACFTRATQETEKERKKKRPLYSSRILKLLSALCVLLISTIRPAIQLWFFLYRWPEGPPTAGTKFTLYWTQMERHIDSASNCEFQCNGNSDAPSNLTQFSI